MATYATTASGVPLPRFSAATFSKGTTAESHPCQTHRCGCSTAEQCWKSCCCYTNGQKLAWAAEHGVTPPQFVVAAARVEATEVESGEPPARDCCRAKRSCCTKSSASSHSASPSTSHATLPTTLKYGGGGGDSQVEAPAGPSIEYVSLLQSERCRGTTPTWGGVAISLAPAPPTRCPAFDPQVCRSAPLPPPAKPHAFSSPSVPPPRAA